MWTELVAPTFRYKTGICLEGLKNDTNSVAEGGLWLDTGQWDLFKLLRNKRKRNIYKE
jgi:hypothetical protein